MEHQTDAQRMLRQKETIEKLTLLLERVSPTPWSANPMGIVLDNDGTPLVRDADGNMSCTDAELAAMAPTLAEEVLRLVEKLLEERHRADAVLLAFKILRNELLDHARELYEDTADDDSGYNAGDSVTNAAAKVTEVLEIFKAGQPLPKMVNSLEDLAELERNHPNARLMTAPLEDASLWTIETIRYFAEQKGGEAFPAVVVINGAEVRAAVKTLEAAK